MAAALSLGPILFNWPAQEKRDFYYRIADEAPIDTVYLGEVVCSKRSPFFDPYIPDIAARLERAGKSVAYSQLALNMTRREMAAARELAALDDALVEVNDLGCTALVEGRPHVIGPFVNVYNEGTVDFLVRRGACRVSLPWELPAKSIAAIAEADLVDLEVQAFGRMPLAISARCYHARAHGLHKDGCQYVCGEDPDGMQVDTLDDQRFLTVNGTQTLSHAIANLIGDVADLQALGVQSFRLWPHSVDMVAVAENFRAVLDGRVAAADAADTLAEVAGFAPFANGFLHGREGMARVS